MPTEKERIIEELRASAPSLARLKAQQEPQALPEDFFANLQKEVLAEVPALEAESEPVVRRISWWRQARYAAAAVLLLLVGLTLWQNRTPATSDMSEVFAQLETEDILAFLEEKVDQGELQDVGDWYEADETSGLLPDVLFSDDQSSAELNEYLLDAELEELESFDIY